MKKLMQERGLTLIEVMIFMAATVLCFFGFLAAFAYVRETQIREANKFTTETLKANVMALMSDDVAWANTLNAVQNAATLGCVKAGTCASGGAFALLDGAGSLFYDSTAAQDGFTSEMNHCDYTSGKPDINCPFMLGLSWTKVSPNLIEVQVRLLYQSHVLHTTKALTPWTMNLIKIVP